MCGCPPGCVTALRAVEFLTAVFPELQAIVSSLASTEFATLDSLDMGGGLPPHNRVAAVKPLTLGQAGFSGEPF